MRAPPTLAIAGRELERIVRQRSLRLLGIVIPLLVSLVLVVLYQRGTARDLPVAVCDRDDSALSRRLVRALDATSGVAVTVRASSTEEVEQALVSGRVEGGLIVPAGLALAVQRGRPATVEILENAANLVVSNTIFKEAQTVTRTLSAGILIGRLAAAGTPAEAAKGTVAAVRVHPRPLFNPGYSYLDFLVPALTMALLQMSIMLGAAVLMSAEREQGSWAELVGLARGRAWRIVVGKALPHLAMHVMVVLVIFGIVFPASHVAAGSFVALVPVLVLYILASFLVGLALSALLPTSALATEAGIFLSTPAFILSGCTFPAWAMPPALAAASLGLPFTHFYSAMLKVWVMGAPLVTARPQLIALGAFAGGGLIVALAATAWRVRGTATLRRASGVAAREATS